jgi:hypothetical protein
MTGLGMVTVSLISAARSSNVLFMILTGVFGTAALFFAGYKAWTEEHERYKKEAQKNAQPDIRGEVSGLNLTQQVSGSGTPGASVFKFILYLCNHRGRNTNIKEVGVSVADDGGSPVKFSSVSSIPPYQSVELQDGIGQYIAMWASTNREIYGTLDLDSLVVHVVDGLGGLHQIPLKTGESLSVGPQS